eukprot:CAMPEP_0185187464 /NCGR_PEP_ID=MMETSP1140-20130426/4758_1 /TAXON_ID=298111 /ORGANISM="Pavlova sp., Strain CCMP459" /LENGTH=57 /DNA_ID=CAMNT_0027753865 /DNA_START=207 /DNA_END=380 /DNA_ORIENTATION=+
MDVLAPLSPPPPAPQLAPSRANAFPLDNCTSLTGPDRIVVVTINSFSRADMSLRVDL